MITLILYYFESSAKTADYYVTVGTVILNKAADKPQTAKMLR
jgi:hypothetical protein